jgi:hypothetical protein
MSATYNPLCFVVAFTFVCLFCVVPADTGYGADAPSPLLNKDKAVDWWFVFKFNAASFPACANDAKPKCPFGGEPQKYGKSFSQQPHPYCLGERIA